MQGTCTVCDHSWYAIRCPEKKNSEINGQPLDFVVSYKLVPDLFQ